MNANNAKPVASGGATPPNHSIDELVQSVTFHTPIQTAFSYLVLPFVPLYAAAFYSWIYVFGFTREIVSMKNATIDDSAAGDGELNEEALPTTINEAGVIIVISIALLHVLAALSCYWSVHALALLLYRRAQQPGANVCAKVIPTPNNGKAEMVRLKMTKLVDGELEYSFVFQRSKYIYDWHKSTFRPVEFPLNELLASYVNWRGLATREAVDEAQRKYGDNDLTLHVPRFLELLQERATAPFFVFQMFSIMLWLFDDYWYYAVFISFMLIVFECSVVLSQQRNMSRIRAMSNLQYPINVFRENEWRTLYTKELLPGDLVSINAFANVDNLVPCDILLLRGSCIVDESLLTGESVPQMKESIESADRLDRPLSSDDYKLYVLNGGTKVVQLTPPSRGAIKIPDNGCLGYVLRNGFYTSQGKLLRTILYNASQPTANNRETFAFILLLTIFGIAAAAYVWIKATVDPNRNRYRLFIQCLILVTGIIPPDLPVELSLAVNSSLLQLIKLYIYCTEPFRIPFAGKLDICCFDKTGTLTSDKLVVEGITGLAGNDECMPVLDAPETTIQVLASCHSLAASAKGLVGDPLEINLLHASGWQIQKSDAISPRHGSQRPMRIVQRFHFSSQLKRMSVIASYSAPHSNVSQYIATVKGAPEIILSMLATTPDRYDEIYQKYARRGARILALAYKKLPDMTNQGARSLQREDVESGLEFAGFVIVSCPIKPDSKRIIAELVQASLQVVMITGDNELTAAHIARELQFSSKEFLQLAPSKHDEWRWVDSNGTTPDNYEGSSLLKPNTTDLLLKQYDFVLTGESLAYLHKNHERFLLKLLPKVTVFARCSPKQKEQIITTLNNLGLCTLMCGDGTNDVGALRHASVGVSLLSSTAVKTKKQEVRPRHPNDTRRTFDQLMEEIDEGERTVAFGDASIAAPFTSRSSSIKCVSHIVKQGRCTLVTTLQMTKILALNALIHAYGHSVLYIAGIRSSDAQSTIQGLILSIAFLSISRTKPLKTLANVAPIPNIFNAYAISTIFMQFAIHFFSLNYLTQKAVELASSVNDTSIVGTLPTDILSQDPANESTEYVPNIVSSVSFIVCFWFQLISLAVNYKGRPFMESFSNNRPLFCTILCASSLVLAMVAGFVPELVDYIELIHFPDSFRTLTLIVLLCNGIGIYFVDRLCAWTFGTTRKRSRTLKQ